MKKRTKKTLSVSGKVLLRLVLATVLCAILYFSMLTIATGMFSDVVGYRIHEMTEDDDIVLVEEHIYKDGEEHITKSDLDLTDDQAFTELREVPKNTERVFHIISQVLMLIVLAIFPYHILWEFGNRDDTKVRYKGQRPDLMRGFRVGALAMIPYAVLWVLLVFAYYGMFPDGYMQVYRVIMLPFLPYINLIITGDNLRDAALWQLLLLLPMLLYVPAVCGISYRLGHNQYSIREHLVFSKKKEMTEEI